MANTKNHNNDDAENDSIISGGGGSGSAAEAEEVVLKKGPWTTAEDAVLMDYVTKHGEGNWNAVQKNTGLARCGKSCRLRWTNHLRPNLKKGAFSPDEEKLILELHSQYGNKWARMAALLPGRTDNEIKNYWNTRVKRRQRQGLPLYSGDVDRPTTSTAPTTTSTTQPSTSMKYDIYNQNYHSLSSSLTGLAYSNQNYHSFLDPNSLPSPSSLSFPFNQSTPLHVTPLRSKRYRTSTPFLDLPLAVPLANLDGFNFPSQFNSSSSHIFQTPLESSSHPNIFSMRMELPSNQFSQSLEPDIKPNMETNGSNSHTSSDLLGDMLEAQATVSGQNSIKRSYSSFSEGNGVFDGCLSLDNSPLSSSYWSSSGLKPNLEQDRSKSVNDISSLLSGMPSTIQVLNWHNHNDVAAKQPSVQSSGVVTPDDNCGIDFKPVASLLPMTTTTNSNENSGFYTWDTLPGLC